MSFLCFFSDDDHEALTDLGFSTSMMETQNNTSQTNIPQNKTAVRERREVQAETVSILRLLPNT